MGLCGMKGSNASAVAQPREASCTLGIRRARGNIAIEDRGHLGHGFQCLVLCGLRREPAHVRSRDHLGMARESRRRHLVGRSAHIERGARDHPLIERMQERGFIDCMTKGAFSLKAPHASEWRLTWWSCDVTGELPSKKFMGWGREKQNTVSKYPVPVSNQIHRAA